MLPMPGQNNVLHGHASSYQDVHRARRLDGAGAGILAGMPKPSLSYWLSSGKHQTCQMHTTPWGCCMSLKEMPKRLWIST